MSKKYFVDTASRSVQDRSRKGTQGFLVYALVLLMFAVNPASAQWTATPAIGLGIQHDDNPSLETASPIGSSVNGYLLEGNINFFYDSQLTDFSILPRARLSRYDGASSLDSEDYFLDLNYAHSGQRSDFRFIGRFGDESVRTAERAGVDFDINDPGDIPVDTSGEVLATNNRQRLQFDPEWSYRTGQRSRMSIGANYIDVTYDKDVFQYNDDFNQITGNAGYEFRFNEKSSLIVDSYYRESYFDYLDRDFSGYGATAGIVNSVSENTRFVARIGFDFTEDQIGNKKANPIGEISVTRFLETSRILATYLRTVSASGAGTISVRDSVSLNLTRDVSPKLSIGAGIRAYKTSALNDATTNFDERKYVQLRALFTWHLTRVFSIDFDFNYTKIDRDSLPSAGDSNVANIWFKYQAMRQQN